MQTVPNNAVVMMLKKISHFEILQTHEGSISATWSNNGPRERPSKKEKPIKMASRFVTCYNQV
jgi:hypothetical protein